MRALVSKNAFLFLVEGDRPSAVEVDGAKGDLDDMVRYVEVLELLLRQELHFEHLEGHAELRELLVKTRRQAKYWTAFACYVQVPASKSRPAWKYTVSLLLLVCSFFWVFIFNIIVGLIAYHSSEDLTEPALSARERRIVAEASMHRLRNALRAFMFARIEGRVSAYPKTERLPEVARRLLALQEMWWNEPLRYQIDWFPRFFPNFFECKLKMSEHPQTVIDVKVYERRGYLCDWWDEACLWYLFYHYATSAEPIDLRAIKAELESGYEGYEQRHANDAEFRARIVEGPRYSRPTMRGGGSY